jgi:plasmid segregation protein ParM
MLEYIAGVDVGNGYLKLGINDKVEVYPSIAVNRYSLHNDLKLTADDVAAFASDAFNQMDVSFSSPLVNDTARRIFGARALASGEPLEEFDVFSRKSKADDDLSGALILGAITSRAIRDYYAENKALPTDILHVDVWLSTALPIAEYEKRHTDYAHKLKNSGSAHLVTIHNFGQTVTVAITVKNVYIANEGEAAQYGLQHAQSNFLALIEEDAKKRALNGELDDVTGEDLVHAENTLGIDIGEGTVDFAVFTNGRFNSDASTSFLKGYGNVLEAALDRLIEEGYTYKTRKELSEFINKEPSKLSRGKYNHVLSIVDEEAYQFAKQLRNEISKIYVKIGATNEVIFVYGGGSGGLEKHLYDQIVELLNEFNSGSTPIIYLNAAYSRFLNEHGLYSLAKGLYNLDHQ